MTDFYQVIAIINLALALFGVVLLLHRYKYIRERFNPQEKVLWIALAGILAAEFNRFVLTIIRDLPGVWSELFLTIFMAVADGALLKPFAPSSDESERDDDDTAPGTVS